MLGLTFSDQFIIHSKVAKCSEILFLSHWSANWIKQALTTDIFLFFYIRHFLENMGLSYQNICCHEMKRFVFLNYKTNYYFQFANFDLQIFLKFFLAICELFSDYCISAGSNNYNSELNLLFPDVLQNCCSDKFKLPLKSFPGDFAIFPRT